MKNIKANVWGVLVSILLLTVLSSCAGQPTQRNKELAAASRGIGEAYMQQGDYTTALQELLKAEQLDPKDHFVQNDLGLAYMAKNKMPEAIGHFKKAIELKPSYTPARNNLGGAPASALKLGVRLLQQKGLQHGLKLLQRGPETTTRHGQRPGGQRPFLPGPEPGPPGPAVL